MSYRTVKELPCTEEGWEDFETIPKGMVCEAERWNGDLVIKYTGKAVCDPDSGMGKEYFTEIQ